MLDAAGGHGGGRRAAAGSSRRCPAALRPLAEAERWVVWRWTGGQAARKPDKVPCQAADPMRHASTQDPGTWGSFAAAMGAVAAARRTAPVTCSATTRSTSSSTSTTAAIPPPARSPTGPCGWSRSAAPTPRSTPSGRGLRIIGLNESFRAPVHRAVAMPEGGRVEIYHRCPRYVTVSGRRLLEAPDELRPICDVAADLLLLAQPEGQGKPDAPPSPAPRSNPDASASPEDIASALAQIPNADLPWEEWSRVGMAVWRASGGSEAGLEAWQRLVGQERQAPGRRLRRALAALVPQPAGSHRLRLAAPPRPHGQPALGQAVAGAGPARAHAATQSAAGGAGDDWEGEKCRTRRRRPPAPLLSR